MKEFCEPKPTKKTAVNGSEAEEIELLEGEHGGGISELPHSSSNSISAAKLLKLYDLAKKRIYITPFSVQ